MPSTSTLTLLPGGGDPSGPAAHPEGPLSRVRERDRVRVSENDALPRPRFAEESFQGGGDPDGAIVLPAAVPRATAGPGFPAMESLRGNDGDEETYPAALGNPGCPRFTNRAAARPPGRHVTYLDFIWTEQFAFAAAAAVVAGTVRGFSGFGAGLVMTPLLALVYGPVDAVVIMMLTVLVGGFQMVPGVLPYATKRDLVPIGAACVFATPLGTWLLVTGDPDVMRRFIGGFVLVSALVMLKGWSYTGPRNARISFGAGLVSGFANGAGGVGGPPVTLYLISSDEPAAVKRANIAVASTLQAVLTVIPMAAAGVVSVDLLLRSAALLVPFAAAIVLGGRLFRRATDRIYRQTALWLLVAVGLAVAFK